MTTDTNSRPGYVMDDWEQYARARHLGRNRLVFLHHEEVVRDFLDYWQTVDARTSIIDVGCAEGLFLVLLRELGFERLCGLDPAPRNIDVLRAKGIQGLVGNVLEPDSLDDVLDRMDAVLLMDVLEHVPDPKVALLNVRQFLLKDQGILYLTAPIYDSIYQKWRRLRDRRSKLEQAQCHDPTHLWGFSQEDVCGYVRASGYTILESKRLYCPIPLVRTLSMQRALSQVLPAVWKGMFLRVLAQIDHSIDGQLETIATG